MVDQFSSDTAFFFLQGSLLTSPKTLSLHPTPCFTFSGDNRISSESSLELQVMHLRIGLSRLHTLCNQVRCRDFLICATSVLRSSAVSIDIVPVSCQQPLYCQLQAFASLACLCAYKGSILRWNLGKLLFCSLAAKKKSLFLSNNTSGGCL